MPLGDFKDRPKVIGTKQVLKAINKSQAKKVYIASDAEPHIITPIKNACAQNQVEVISIESMEMLGKACGIDVGSAAVALLDD